jgi:hypothetical protein
MFRVLILSISFLLCACSAAPKESELPKPIIKSLALIPATAPNAYRYGFSDVSGALAAFFFKKGQKSNTDRKKAHEDKFDDAMKARSLGLDRDFTIALIAELTTLGYKVTILESFDRDVHSPDYVNYKALNYQADAVLHVYFGEIGVYAPKNGTPFFPQLNTAGVALMKGRKKYLYDDAVYYGVDADPKDTMLSIAPVPSNGFADFEDVIANLDKLQDNLRLAIPKIAKRMASNIHEKLK